MFFRIVYILHVHFTKGASNHRICYLHHSTLYISPRVHQATEFATCIILHYTFHQGCIKPPNLLPASFYIIHFTKGASSHRICYLHHSTLYISPRVHQTTEFATCIILHYTFHQGCIKPPNLLPASFYIIHFTKGASSHRICYLHHSTLYISPRVHRFAEFATRIILHYTFHQGCIKPPNLLPASFYIIHFTKGASNHRICYLHHSTLYISPRVHQTTEFATCIILHYTFHQGCIKPPNLLPASFYIIHFTKGASNHQICYLHHSTLYISPRVHQATEFATCIILHYTFHQGCIKPPNLLPASFYIIHFTKGASSRRICYLHHSTLYISPRVHRAAEFATCIILHYTFHQGCIKPPNLLPASFYIIHFTKGASNHRICYLHHSTLYISPRVHQTTEFATCIILHYTFHQGCIKPPNLLPASFYIIHFTKGASNHRICYLHHSTLYISPRVHQATKFATCIILHYTFHQGCIKPPNLLPASFYIIHFTKGASSHRICYLHHSTLYISPRVHQATKFATCIILHYTFHQGCIKPPNLLPASFYIIHFTKGASNHRICYSHHSTGSRVISEIKGASSRLHAPFISLTYEYW